MLTLRYHTILRTLLPTLYLLLVGLPCRAADCTDICCDAAACAVNNRAEAHAPHAHGSSDDHNGGKDQGTDDCTSACACPCHTPATPCDTPLLRTPGQGRTFYYSCHASVLTSERIPPDHIPLS